MFYNQYVTHNQTLLKQLANRSRTQSLFFMHNGRGITSNTYVY